jgi:predicted nuclease of predicted toxin-antitoxin system
VKIKLDENMPATLAAILTAYGHDTDTVHEEGLTGSSDHDVWQETQRAGRFLITQDLDFSDLRQFQPGSHFGLLLIRLPNPSRQSLIELVDLAFKTEAIETWQRCFVVLTDRKIRIRRP